MDGEPIPRGDRGIDKLANKDTEVVAALKETAHPLRTLNPETEDTSDLEAFGQMVGDACLVGLGEATHGNREFSQAKDRFIRYLVKQKGFDGVILETPTENAEEIDQYIKSSDALDNRKLREVVNGLANFPHRTEEVEDMIRWMKEYNLQHPDEKISFKGCDIPGDDERQQSVNGRDQAMAENCIKLLDEDGGKKYALWSHNYHVGYTTDDEDPTISQGAVLHDQINGYVNFGMLFNKGSFNAAGFDEETKRTTGLEVFAVPPLGAGSYEDLFAQTEESSSIIDLRELRDNPLFADWNQQKHTQRLIGAGFAANHPEYYISKTPLAKRYDGVVWIDTVTPSEIFDMKSPQAPS